MSQADWSAISLSLQLAAVSTLLLMLIGIPLAWWLCRTGSRLRPLCSSLVTLPMVLPPTVLGFYLLMLLAPDSPIGKAIEALGLGLLIWDAYRPYSVTVRFWKLIHDERYVANPAKGSGHNRGIAVDLSLYHLSSGKALSMPTDFDDFSEKAHHGYAQLNQEQIKNRELLLSLMVKYGFKKFETEWWHYYWPDSEKYEILDIPFNKLKMLK